MKAFRVIRILTTWSFFHLLGGFVSPYKYSSYRWLLNEWWGLLVRLKLQYFFSDFNEVSPVLKSNSWPFIRENNKVTSLFHDSCVFTKLGQRAHHIEMIHINAWWVILSTTQIWLSRDEATDEVRIGSYAQENYSKKFYSSLLCIYVMNIKLKTLGWLIEHSTSGFKRDFSQMSYLWFYLRCLHNLQPKTL